MSQVYVLGFLFSSDFSSVCLIEKQKPKWQQGRLNGVGGKVEAGEALPDAMAREFTEETGVSLNTSAWTPYASLKGADASDWRVHIFFAVDDRINDVRTMEEEKVIVTSSKAVVLGEFKTMGNVPWLVSMALAVATAKESCSMFEIQEMP